VSSGGKVEMVSVAGAKKAIFDADVVALVIDASAGATDQDAAIGGEADRAGRGIVIIANKWDLVKSQDVNFSKTFDANLRHGMRFLDYAPILHISALTGERAPKVIETIDKIAETRRKRIPTPVLNKFIGAEITATVRHIPIEVPLGSIEGIPKPCVVNCDNLRTISKVRLVKKISKLSAKRVHEVKRAVGYAFAWEELIDAGE